MTSQNSQGQPVNGHPIISVPLISHVAGKDLLAHRAMALNLALPGLGEPSAGLMTALLKMATAVEAQTNDQLLAREAPATEALVPTLLSAKFCSTLQIVMDDLQVHPSGVSAPSSCTPWSPAMREQTLETRPS